MESVIKQKLASLSPIHLQIINESHMHAGPATHSHFKLVVVSDEFLNLSKVACHQKIYSLLSKELEGELHALSMFLYSQDEWEKQQSVPESPKCQGANK